VVRLSVLTLVGVAGFSEFAGPASAADPITIVPPEGGGFAARLVPGGV
jgi:hypothetical protein